MAVAPSTWGRNPCDNIAQINKAFTAQTLNTGLFSKNLGLAPLNDRTNPLAMPFIYILSRGAIVIKGSSNKEASMMAHAIANAIAPNMDNNQLAQNEAQAQARDNIIAFMASEGMSSQLHTFNSEAYTAAIAEHGSLYNYRTALPANYNALVSGMTQPANVTMVTAVSACALVRVICEFFSTPKLNSIGTRMYSIAFIAMSKRGNLTDQKADQINEAMITEGFGQLNITSDLVRSVYVTLEGCLNESNAGEAFKEWADNISKLSLRMNITLTQASGSGLTALSICKEALRMFYDFPWFHIVRLLPLEWAKLEQAIRTVGNNQYYGFRKDLGEVKSTNYKSISWLCKELLLRLGGPAYNKINKYAGWPSVPLYVDKLEILIINYEKFKGRDSAPLQDMVATVEQTASVNKMFELFHLSTEGDDPRPGHSRQA